MAVGNRITRSAQPLTTLAAREGVPRWEELQALLQEWQPALAVVGQPLNMDGSESDMSQRAARFARRLEGRFQLQTVLVDERLSSFEARRELRESGHSGDYRSQPADALAACLILESWLREQAAG